MRIEKFSYLKEGSEEPKNYELLVLTSDEVSNYGIAINYLNEQQQEELLKITADYELALKPFMKYFRNFKKQNIISQ